MAYVEQRMGTATLPVQPRRLDRLDHVFVDHDLQAAAFWANLTAQLRDHTPRVRRFTWLGERELRARRMRVRDPDGKYWLPFLPDAYFEVDYTDGRVQCALVEIDMGTLTLRRFARKIRAFETVLDREVFRKHFEQDEFEVFVLTHSWRRLQALWQAAYRVVESDRRPRYFFATFVALEPDEFAEWEWCDLNNEKHDGVLYGEEESDDEEADDQAEAAGGSS